MHWSIAIATSVTSGQGPRWDMETSRRRGTANLKPKWLGKHSTV